MHSLSLSLPSSIFHSLLPPTLCSVLSFSLFPRQLLPCTCRHFFPNAVLTATATRVIRCTCRPSLLLFHCPIQFLPSSSFRCSPPCWATLSSNCWLSCWQSRISCWQCSQWIFTYAPATHTHSNTHTHSETHTETHTFVNTHNNTHSNTHSNTQSNTNKHAASQQSRAAWK